MSRDSKMKLLLCTDMDRTVIPNGKEPEDPRARRRFRAFCSREEVALVYVTGRHQALVKDAIKAYGLPEPDFAITDVGTKIYRVNDNAWQPLESWEEEIDKAWKGKSHEQIRQLLEPVRELELQEKSKQNTHKLSYYLSLDSDHQSVMARMQHYLDDAGIMASLIWSIDEPKNIGLLDCLPQNATKQHAIEFLQSQLGYRKEEVVFAGDSGNDLPVLVSPVPSVLVANASDDIKADALRLVKENGNGDAFYIAKAGGLGMNGNYAAGVLQGVWHFAPAFRSILEQTKEIE